MLLFLPGPWLKLVSKLNWLFKVWHYKKTAQTSNTRLKDTGIVLIGLNYSIICGLVVCAISFDMVMLVIGIYWYSYWTWIEHLTVKTVKRFDFIHRLLQENQRPVDWLTGQFSAASCFPGRKHLICLVSRRSSLDLPSIRARPWPQPLPLNGLQTLLPDCRLCCKSIFDTGRYFLLVM